MPIASSFGKFFMAKQLDEKTVLNELHGESVFFQPTPSLAQETSSPQGIVTKRKQDALSADAAKETVRSYANADDTITSQSVDRTVDPTTGPLQGQPTTAAGAQSASQPDTRFVDQSVDPLASELIAHTFDTSSLLPRPKAFYITEKQDEELDVLVKRLSERLKGKVTQKIDRSVVTRLIFENVNLTGDETVAQLANLLVRRLTSQLTSPQVDITG